MQIGGSDQWGNITNGCDLIKKKAKAEAFGLTLPLLTTANGMKFGKTENNALFVNLEKTPTSEIYNYFYSTSDDKIEEYLKLFTFLPQ